MAYRLGELFCGPGGLACGAVNALCGNPGYNIAHEWATDYDFDTCNTYRQNICDDFHKSHDTVLHTDVRRLDFNKLTPINALAFGFPCNDFSIVGEQKGVEGNFGPLYQYGIKVLESFYPDWFLAENVGGLKSANGGNAFAGILTELNEAGYKVFPHLYKFEQYGVPQARHRIIIVGIRKDLPYEFKPPSPNPYQKEDISVRKALSDIPKNAKNNELTKQSKVVVERLQYIKPGQNIFNADLPDNLKLNIKGATISQIYKRLDPDKPAYTVTGSGGGGTHMYHYDEPRALTNRERARLQTFDDTFEFVGSKESVRKQIGMAVPPKGARIIFEAILNTFAGIPYESIPCNIHERVKLC